MVSFYGPQTGRGSARAKTDKLTPRYPPNTPEKKEKLGAFFGKFPPPATAANVPTYVQAVKQQYASLTKFGIVGVS